MALADYPAEEVERLERKREVDSEEMWSLVYRFVLQGQSSDALKVLAMLLERQEDGQCLLPFLPALGKVFEQMPAVSYSSNVDGPFLRRFEQWRNVCKQVQKDVSRVSEQLASIFDILLGNKEAIRTHAKHWFEMLLAHLLYVTPGLVLDDLPDLCETLWKKKTPSNAHKDFAYHSILLSILTDNLGEAISIARSAAADKSEQNVQPWCLTHLVDLL